MSLVTLVSWVLPVIITLIGGVLGLLKFLTEHQEKSAAGLRADIETLRNEMNENDDENRTAIETCRSQHHQAAANFRLLIAEQREKIAEQRLETTERVLDKSDFREFTHRLEDRLGRLEIKIDQLSAASRS